MIYKYVLVSIEAGDYWYRYREHIVDKVFFSREAVVNGEFISELAWSIDHNGPCQIEVPDDRTFFDGAYGVNFIEATFEEYKEKELVMRSPEMIRKEILGFVPKGEVKAIPQGLKGKMVGEFNRIWGGTPNRRIILGWLFTGSFADPISTAQLTNTQIAALLDWMQPAHQVGGWVLSPTFRSEAALCYAYVASQHVKTVSYNSPGTANKMILPEQLLKELK